jgi:hypothetical protein
MEWECVSHYTYRLHVGLYLVMSSLVHSGSIQASHPVAGTEVHFSSSAIADHIFLISIHVISFLVLSQRNCIAVR